MSALCCPVPNCTEPVPAGPHAVFCLEHYFQLPHRTTSTIFSLQIACSRTDDDDAKAHLREQIAAHISIAVRSLTERPGERAFSQENLDEARSHDQRRRELLGQLPGGQTPARNPRTGAQPRIGD